MELVGSLTSSTARRLAGVVGLSGALLLFAGDMLFYGHFGSGAEFRTGMISVAKHASTARLFVGGLVGPLAACLCVLGFWHVYENCRARQASLALIMLTAFSILMIFGGAVHALYTDRMLALQYCAESSGDCAQLGDAIGRYWSVAYQASSVPGYVGAVILFCLVVLGRTQYPRWTALANPGLLIAFEPLAHSISAPIGAVLVGGFTNLSIATFFLVSVCTTWRVATRSA